MKIQIISSSIREGRHSHSVALYLKDWFEQNTEASVNIIDLKERNYPLFEERLGFMVDKPKEAIQFSNEIDEADAVIILAPEYNGSFPASLKNVIDLLYSEWQKKPVAIAPISTGNLAGAQVAEQLQFVMYKIGALVTKARFHVANVKANFDEDGTCNDKEFYDKQASVVWKNLQFFIKANQA